MDQRVQCPVCTLYLHSGMSLESHLDTHPKDQVIKALCNLSKSASYGSRTPTPSQSERSYRSRSRTPATDDSGRWANSQRNSDSERYWRRTPSRTKSTPLSSVSRNATPDLKISNISFENQNSLHNSSQGSDSYTLKSDKTQQTFGSHGQTPVSDFEQQYPYYSENPEDPEIKFSRSSEYNSQLDNSNNVFAYNMPAIGAGVKLQTALMSNAPKRGNEFVKILPKQSNIVLKTNMAGMQYISPGVKPLHVMVPTAAPFVQKNLPNNMIMTGNVSNPQMMDPKAMAPPLANQFNQMTSGAFTPGTTVVTQNSQIIYREMVHSIDGKPFISSMPTVLSGHENGNNVAQSSSMYQNVMVVDQFGNTSCMYTTPQQLLPKPCNSTALNDNVPYNIPNVPEKSVGNIVNDTNKTLIIEVSPMLPLGPINTNNAIQSTQQVTEAQSGNNSIAKEVEKKCPKIETPGPSKGLKILSNIKVGVPVKHHKNMINKVLDLTGPSDSDYPERPITPEKILPDLEENNQSVSDDCTQPSSTSGDSLTSNAFSVIKNVNNSLYKEPTTKCTVVNDSKIDTEFSDSCPVPDLICNEKPSISPCSELSEQGDSSTDCISLSPKPENSQVYQSTLDNNEVDIENKLTDNTQKSNPLKLNNIFVKKHKKILRIKNEKPFPSTSNSESIQEPIPSSSTSKSPEHFVMNKIHHPDNSETSNGGTMHTIVIEKLKDHEDNHNEFDANTEEQSMDIEPVTPSNVTHSNQYNNSIDVVQVKEEVNTSNEFSNERSHTELAPMESLRPINVINYGSMAGDFDEDSNNRELLELEAVSKNKQFVSMMNENYFGDNIYADYFTPDRVEAFEAEKESNFGAKDGSKDGMYIWGEPSQKESEYVLPNFIHESYKIADSSGMEYSNMGGGEEHIDADRCERDSKVDVLSESRSDGEPALNICADERMPPRGELSGQESNGDMESPWSGMYSGVPPAEPYDLIARESWVSDGSDVDANEKTDNLEDELHFSKQRGMSHTCSQCPIKCGSLKELRTHRALAHASPTCSKTTYSRLITARSIKKEEKPDEHVLAGNLLTMDSKETMASTMLQVYDAMTETKPQIAEIIKQETKKRRRDFVCPTCKVDQVTDAAFHAHLKIHPLECLTCGKCFFRRANLALHVKTHLGIKNYKCDVCEKRFITRQKLAEHHNTHTGRTPVKCTLCDDTFRRYSNMVQHRDRHHFKKKAKIRDYVCHCGSVFHSRAKLLWHKETHDEKPKACLYCSDKFVHAASLTRHVRRTHNEYFLSEKLKGKTENVPCPVCKQMYLRTNLRAHLQTHSGKRPYHCVICNKAFTTKWNLKLHRWTHLSRSAKPFKCNLCKGAFIRQTEYVAHMNAHKSVRPYTCNYCGCQFIRKYNCQRHVREHEMAKKYVCKVPECGKSFHRSYYLSEHMKVHSGARPFSCNICGKTSSNKSNHNKHVKIHHAREPVATEA